MKKKISEKETQAKLIKYKKNLIMPRIDLTKKQVAPPIEKVEIRKFTGLKKQI